MVCCNGLTLLAVAVDSFLLKKQKYLGKLTAVRIGHDNKGLAPGAYTPTD